MSRCFMHEECQKIYSFSSSINLTCRKQSAYLEVVSITIINKREATWGRTFCIFRGGKNLDNFNDLKSASSRLIVWKHRTSLRLSATGSPHFLTRLTADAAWARPQRSSQANLCPAAHHSTIIPWTAKNYTQHKVQAIDVVCTSVHDSRQATLAVCGKKNKNDRLRQRFGESGRLLAGCVTISGLVWISKDPPFLLRHQLC